MLSGSSILLVEDVRSMRLMLRCALRNFGVQDIGEAGDGQEALQALAGRRFGLIISDLEMKPMDGVTLTRHLRSPGTAFAATPIVIFSGANDISRVKAALAAGASDFLIKPLIPSELKARLEKVLRNPAPVVKTKTYHGPERRRRRLWVRNDRRQNELAFEPAV